MNPHPTDPLRAVQHARFHEPDPARDDELQLVRCLHRYQINPIEGSDEVTVTYPPGSDTVLSVEPDGTWHLVPAGQHSPKERAVVQPDRVVFAPLGSAGAAFLLPYADVIPNV